MFSGRVGKAIVLCHGRLRPAQEIGGWVFARPAQESIKQRKKSCSVLKKAKKKKLQQITCFFHYKV